MSRTLASRRFLAYVDWSLLILFIALFILIEGFQATGGLDAAYQWLLDRNFDLYSPFTFSVISIVLSNLVSNVPAVMLLMAKMPDGIVSLQYLLSINSTLAGNLILIGSIANLIVAEQATKDDIPLSFKNHFTCTSPIAINSIILAYIWWLVMVTWTS
jgi:Na+/H+ antiporter NhaD/arsenite permease-like protein